MSSKRAPPLPQPMLDDLSDELLLRVLCCMPPAQRPSLALVCKRWQGLCEGAGPLWEDLFINFRHVYNSSYLYKWLLPRRGCVRGLTIITETEEDWLAAHLVLGLVAAGLERLVVRAGTEGLGMASTDWLGVLTQLKSLQLAYDRQTLVHMAAFPPGLEALVLRPVGAWAICAALPYGLATAAALTKLQLSRVAMDDVPGDDVKHNGWCRLLHLTALQRLAISSGKLACLPDGMTALTRLSSLTLTECLDSPCFDTPEGLAPLSGLTALSLLNLSVCGLSVLPPPVAVLPALRTLLVSGNKLVGLPAQGPYLANLECLDLSMNLQLEALPEALLSCSRLETVDLSGAVQSTEAQPAAQYLRQLLTANPHMRELRISTSMLAASQLAKLQTAFPQVRLLELDPLASRAWGRDGGGGASLLLGSASSSSDDEEWDGEGEKVAEEGVDRPGSSA